MGLDKRGVLVLWFGVRGMREGEGGGVVGVGMPLIRGGTGRIMKMYIYEARQMKK